MVVGIIGLGMMGGSLARALRQSHDVTKIIGYDTNYQHAQQFLILEFCDEIVDLDNILSKSDVLFLIIPAQGIIKLMPHLEQTPQTTTIIDFASTKKNVAESIPSTIRERFVTSHPMAGIEKSGPIFAAENLYQNKK